VDLVEMGVIEEEKEEEIVMTPIKESEELDLGAVQRVVTIDAESSTMAMALGLDGGHSNGQQEDVELQLAQHDVECFKCSARLLYAKYIKEGADWEVNIGHEQRQHFLGLERVHYASLNTMEWVTLYDDIVYQMERYMMQSYNRMILQLHRAEQEENLNSPKK